MQAPSTEDQVKMLQHQLAAANIKIGELNEQLTNLHNELHGKDVLPMALHSKLSATEISLLAGMYRVFPRVFSRELAYECLYGGRPQVPGAKVLDVLVCKMRPKLVPFGLLIETMWGPGWLLNRDSHELIGTMIEDERKRYGQNTEAVNE